MEMVNGTKISSYTKNTNLKEKKNENSSNLINKFIFCFCSFPFITIFLLCKDNIHYLQQQNYMFYSGYIFLTKIHTTLYYFLKFHKLYILKYSFDVLFIKKKNTDINLNVFFSFLRIYNTPILFMVYYFFQYWITPLYISLENFILWYQLRRSIIASLHTDFCSLGFQ